VKKSSPWPFALLSYAWLKASISWSVSSYRKFKKFLLEGFRINLKKFLSLAMPNQYCQTAVKEMRGWLGWAENLHYTVLLHCMIMINIYSNEVKLTQKYCG